MTQKKLTLENISSLPVHYEEGDHDPSADVRYREEKETVAREIFNNAQLGYVVSQLQPDDNPVKFYVCRLLCEWSYLGVYLMLNKNGQEDYKELCSGKETNMDKIIFHWKPTIKSETTLEEWYNRWLNDPWR